MGIILDLKHFRWKCSWSCLGNPGMILIKGVIKGSIFAASLYVVIVVCFTSGSFHQHGLTLIPACISNHMHSKVLDEITYSFLNFNCATIEV